MLLKHAPLLSAVSSSSNSARQSQVSHQQTQAVMRLESNVISEAIEVDDAEVEASDDREMSGSVRV